MNQSIDHYSLDPQRVMLAEIKSRDPGHSQGRLQVARSNIRTCIRISIIHHSPAIIAI